MDGIFVCSHFIADQRLHKLPFPTDLAFYRAELSPQIIPRHPDCGFKIV